MTEMFETLTFWLQIISVSLAIISSEGSRKVRNLSNRVNSRLLGSTPASSRTKNIVVIGASFAGAYTVRHLTNGLPPRCNYRIIVIEPNSHFVFTWLLPRFCVVEGHEHKAFIPYKGTIKDGIGGSVQWIQDFAVDITETHVRLRDSKEEIPYEYLVVATGSAKTATLPATVPSSTKSDGIEDLKAMQEKIRAARSIVVVGAGAVGVELVTDIKDQYPEKDVTIVHSRSTLMNRFGKSLQEKTMQAMEDLGIKVILQERVVEEDAETGTIVLKTGRTLTCDLYINCTGQKPASNLIGTLAPNVISETGHIRVKPTLQLDDERFQHIFACGDVAQSGQANPNALYAGVQAGVVADNIILCVEGKSPTKEYQWIAQSIIKLTLGLHRSVMHFVDEHGEVAMEQKENIDLMAPKGWKAMGAQPFVE